MGKGEKQRLLQLNSLMMNPIGLNAFVKAFGDIRFSHSDRYQGVGLSGD